MSYEDKLLNTEPFPQNGSYKIIYKDKALGMSLNTFFTKLLIPAISTKTIEASNISEKEEKKKKIIDKESYIIDNEQKIKNLNFIY